MNNAFGHIPEDLLQQAHDAWEFKTCQRSDGTTYGTAGNCSQKGAKEAKSGDVARMRPKTKEDFKRKPRLLARMRPKTKEDFKRKPRLLDGGDTA